MKALNLSWAIYLLPSVKAAAADPDKRAHARAVYSHRGECSQIQRNDCTECVLYRPSVADMCYTLRWEAGPITGNKARIYDLLTLLKRSNTI
jgi:hypothetical protein